MSPDRATPAQLRARAASLDRKANENALAGLHYAARTQRAHANTLRQLAREAIEFQHHLAADRLATERMAA